MVLDIPKIGGWTWCILGHTLHMCVKDIWNCISYENIMVPIKGSCTFNVVHLQI